MAILLLLGGGAVRAAEPPTVDAAKFLTGCWSGTSGTRSFEERWMAPRGGAMVGAARSFKGDAMTSVELTILRIRDGKLVYDANPVGQPPATFMAITADGSQLVFENKEHDFPQRIIYRRVSVDELFARIEGTIGGKERAVDYPMKRVPCE